MKQKNKGKKKQAKAFNLLISKSGLLHTTKMIKHTLDKFENIDICQRCLYLKMYSVLRYKL